MVLNLILVRRARERESEREREREREYIYIYMIETEEAYEGGRERELPTSEFFCEEFLFKQDVSAWAREPGRIKDNDAIRNRSFSCSPSLSRHLETTICRASELVVRESDTNTNILG